MGVLLVVMFIVFVAIGVPISFALGVVSFTGIASLGQIPNLVVFQKMFNYSCTENVYRSEQLYTVSCSAVYPCSKPNERR